LTILYCDATLGVSGDMFLGALVDVGVPVETIRSAVGDTGIERWQIRHERVERKGIAASRVIVEVEEEPAHRRLADVRAIIERSSLDEYVKEGALAVFERIASAEGKVHAKPLEQVHFHEVGALDAVIDVVGTLAGVQHLGVDEVVASPIATGAGTVHASHGVLPVPAPATAELLRGAAVTGGDLEGECSTPTGVALLLHLASRQGGLPDATIARVGYGAGSRDAATHPNCLRLFVCEAGDREADTVCVLETNIDDMPAQLVGPLYDRLFEAGALDVYATGVQMKKGRPGLLLTVVAPPAKRAVLEEIIFRETTTLGVRRHSAARAKLARRMVPVETRFGKIDVKIGILDGEAVTAAPEFEECLAAAREHSVPVKDVCDVARAAYLASREGSP